MVFFLWLLLLPHHGACLPSTRNLSSPYILQPFPLLSVEACASIQSPSCPTSFTLSSYTLASILIDIIAFQSMFFASLCHCFLSLPLAKLNSSTEGLLKCHHLQKTFSFQSVPKSFLAVCIDSISFGHEFPSTLLLLQVRITRLYFRIEFVACICLLLWGSK